jgi:hypothetical protein
LFISPTVNLDHRYLHLPYPPAVVVDHQQSAPIHSTQRHWHDKCPGCHSITTSLVSPILTTSSRTPPNLYERWHGTHNPTQPSR